ncbi:MAG: hypothetical protein ACO268_04890 [Opitutales bacterium]|jgi:hypothetical protein
MRLLLAALLSTSALLAQEPAPARALPADTSVNKLRGINYLFIDVKVNDQRSEDGDLRAELRDVVELELRRNNVAPKEAPMAPNESHVPLLTIEVRFDRALGRSAADIELSIRDTATVVRNNEKVMAVTYTQVKKAMAPSDSALPREVKARARELVTELIDGLRKANGR